MPYDRKKYDNIDPATLTRGRTDGKSDENTRQEETRYKEEESGASWVELS
ncbi:unnamed protein product [marine sediment metagenome]|uniref:Uncharacterized protein n=1 Tax=marine sediment metagenome TaxID=412755 RepID=X1BYN6_9ZZZZ